jgi:hypothetical protein
MHALQQRGLAIAQICTEPFKALGKTQARVYGMPALPFVFIAHPLGGLTLEAVEGRAEAAIENIAALIRERLK